MTSPYNQEIDTINTKQAFALDFCETKSRYKATNKLEHKASLAGEPELIYSPWIIDYNMAQLLRDRNLGSKKEQRGGKLNAQSY